MNSCGQQAQRIVGVMGGMGPDATVDFLAKVVAATDATCDQDHVHMLIDHNPRLPNRHAAIAGTGADIGPDLAAMATRLEHAGADFLVMVCNTAHAFTRDIRAAVSIPFVSIIDVVMDELAIHRVQRVGVMAAEGCLQAGLYQNALTAAGFEPVLWNDRQLARFMALIYRIKSGDRDKAIAAGMRKLAAELVFNGAELLVAGCTEVPLFVNEQDTDLPLLSSTDLLVRRTIAFAKNPPLTES